MNTLAHQIRKHLPPGYCVTAGKLASGHVHVHVAYRQGAYNLTITEADKPISPETIAANAVALLGEAA